MFARILATGLFVSLTALACTAARKDKGDDAGVPGAHARLDQIQPTDVAVAPVRDQTDSQRVPLDVFRIAFVDTLIERRYSPLAPDYVDANWLDASFRGTPPPDAVLVVAVTAWDPSHLFSTGKVAASALVQQDVRGGSHLPGRTCSRPGRWLPPRTSCCTRAATRPDESCGSAP